MKKSNFTILLF